jgi:hypothetical protein
MTEGMMLRRLGSLGLARAVSILGSLFALAGCANYSTLQTAETMREDKFLLGLGATFTSYQLRVTTTTTGTNPNTGQPVETTTRKDDRFTVPALTISGRYGLTDRLELHGVAWIPLGTSFGLKYMLVGDPKQLTGFIFSPGLDVSVPLSVSVLDSKLLFFDVYVPMHMGFRPSPSFELYWTPKYVLRRLGDEFSHAVGGTVGVAVGSGPTFMLEGGALYDSLFAGLIPTVGIGVAFN